MIVAITGGTGTVGRRLAERHVGAGDTVRVLSRQVTSALPAAVQMHPGDLASEHSILSRFADGADVLYHCAAEIHEPGRMMAVNAGGTRNLLAAAQHHIGRWVQLGSIAVYGAPESGWIDEEAPLRPIDVYGRSKAEADRLVLDAARAGAFQCFVVRPAKIFGAGTPSANNQILFRLFSALDRRLFFFIGRPGALTHYLHIDNLIDALARCGCARLVGSRVYNLSDDCPIEDFVAVIASALGKDPPTLRLPESPVRALARLLGSIPGFPLNERRVAALVNHAHFPIARIQSELGYEPCMPLARGLRELVDFWRRKV